MSNGGQVPAQLVPLLAQYMSSGGMQNSAMAGQTNTPTAGSMPTAQGAQPVYGQQTGANAPAPGATSVIQPPQANQPSAQQNPYQSFVTALQQIQQANPIQAIGQATPDARKSQAAQQATMHETGVG